MLEQRFQGFTRGMKWRCLALLLAMAGLGAVSAPVYAAAAEDGEKIIITGASGQLGRLVVEELLARQVPAADLILVSRSPDELENYAEMGASVRFGDFTQPASLPAAFAGGRRMLLISISGMGLDRPAMHKNAIDAAKQAGVVQIAYTSYVNADRNTQSLLAQDHRRTEQILEQSGVAWTFLRNQIYMNGQLAAAREAAGSGTLTTWQPDLKVAYVTREDCAAAAAAVLATPGHDNTAYNITGPQAVGAVELGRAVALLSGRPVAVEAMTQEVYIQHQIDAGVPERAARGGVGLGQELDSLWLAQPDSAVGRLTGRPATGLYEFLATQRAAWETAQ